MKTLRIWATLLFIMAAFLSFGQTDVTYNNVRVKNNAILNKGYYLGGNGDVTNNGTVNATDALWLIQYLAGMITPTPEQLCRMDVDGDGFITKSDWAIIHGIGVGIYPNSITDFLLFKHTVGLYNSGLDASTNFRVRRELSLDSAALGNKSLFAVLTPSLDNEGGYDVRQLPWDSITANLPGGNPEIFYITYGCYNGAEGWKHSGDTLYIDTCFTSSGAPDSLFIAHGCFNDPDEWKFSGDTIYIDTCFSCNWVFVDDAVDTLKNGVALNPGVLLFKSDVITDFHLYSASNTLLGRGAGNSLHYDSGSEGQYNTAIGNGALYSNADNYGSTAVGYNAMYYADDRAVGRDTYNTAVGREALQGAAPASGNTGQSNNAFGYRALKAMSSGNYNVGIGNQAGTGITSGTSNIAIGHNALYSNSTAYDNIAIGTNALQSTTTAGNVAIGSSSGQDITGTYNTFLGYFSGKNSKTSMSNTCIGAYSLGNAASGQGVSDYNVALGANSLYSDSSSNYNVAVGYEAMKNLKKGNGNNIGIGPLALYNQVANDGSLAIGYLAMYNADNRTTGRTTYNTAVGYEAMKGSATAANNTGQYNTAVGHSALSGMTSGYNNTAIGYKALLGNTTGSWNLAIGNEALASNSTKSDNLAIGYKALYSETSSSLNMAIGEAALYTLGSTGAAAGANLAIGYNSQYASSDGLGNTSIGMEALKYDVSGDYNTAIGKWAMMGISTKSHNYNSAIGCEALKNINNADYNTAIGYQSGILISTGSSNVLIGSGSGGQLTTESNKLYVENSNSTTPLIYGEFDNDIMRVYGTKVERTDKTIADNDATPDVSASNVWTYAGSANAVTVTDLDNPDVGAIYYIIGNSDTYTVTIDDAGNFNLSAQWVGGLDDVLILYVQADNDYIEFGRVNN